MLYSRHVEAITLVRPAHLSILAQLAVSAQGNPQIMKSLNGQKQTHTHHFSRSRPDLLIYIRACLIVYLLESDESDVALS